MDPENKIKTKNIETYAQDMLGVLESNKDGLIKKIIAEQEEKEIERKQSSPQSIKNRLFIILGLLFVLIGLGGIGFLYFNLQNQTAVVVEQSKPVIFLDGTRTVEIAGMNKDKVTEVLLRATSLTEVKEEGIEALYLTEEKSVIGFSRFVSIIEGNFTQPNTNIVKDSFLFGVRNTENKDLFFLFKILSFQDAFPVMRNWESKMFLDLHGFFGVPIEAETSYLLIKEFEDGIIQNQNARILYDKDGKIVMMYVYTDDTTITIANSEETIREIIARLAASKIRK